MIVGIDPGKTGGVAALTDDGELWGAMRMPTFQEGKRTVIDTKDIDRAVWSGVDEAMIIVIEAVHAMPGQGVSSTFNFGRFMGAVEGWAHACGDLAEVVYVSPQTWKKHFNLSRDKRASLALAKSYFDHGEGCGVNWDVLANDGIAEAALIALWYIQAR